MSIQFAVGQKWKTWGIEMLFTFATITKRANLLLIGQTDMLLPIPFIGHT